MCKKNVLFLENWAFPRILVYSTRNILYPENLPQEKLYPGNFVFSYKKLLFRENCTPRTFTPKIYLIALIIGTPRHLCKSKYLDCLRLRKMLHPGNSVKSDVPKKNIQYFSQHRYFIAITYALTDDSCCFLVK